jgi:fatty acid desaturase
MIPVYSLLHEAEHGIFHPNKKMNYFSGLHLSNLFIVSFTFFQQCHLNHHKHNRTDFEMWDLYYKHQNKFLKYVNFYLKMMGAVYLMLPLSAVLFTLYPPIVFSKIFTGHNETGGFVKGTDTRSKLNRIRIESLGAILFQAALIFVLKLNFFSYGIMYLIHGFVWSSQNYVSHAFSPRDIINGAHNHTISKFVKLIYLNFNVHLAHHQNPQIPWIHLPQVIEKNQQQDSFLKAYLRFWKGPQLTNEPAPN